MNHSLQMIKLQSAAAASFCSGRDNSTRLSILTGFSWKSSAPHVSSINICSNDTSRNDIALIATSALDSTDANWLSDILDMVFTKSICTDPRWRIRPDKVFQEALCRFDTSNLASMPELVESNWISIGMVCPLQSSEVVYVGTSSKDAFAVHYPADRECELLDRHCFSETTPSRSSPANPVLGQYVDFQVGDRMLLCNDSAWVDIFDINSFMDFFDRHVPAFQLISEWQNLAASPQKDAVLTIMERLV